MAIGFQSDASGASPTGPYPWMNPSFQAFTPPSAYLPSGAGGSPQIEQTIQQLISNARKPKPLPGGTGRNTPPPTIAAPIVPASTGMPNYQQNSPVAASSYVDPTAAAATSNSGGYNSNDPSQWSTPTGWAANYTPNVISNIAYTHPEILAGDVLKKMHMTNPMLAAMLGSNGAYGALAGTIQNGGKALTDNDIVNYLGNYFTQESTVGGKTPNTQALVNTLLKAADDPTSPLGSYLNQYNTPSNSAKGGGSALEQSTQLLNSVILNSMNDINPYAQKGMQSYLNQMQTNYTGALAHGQNPGSYAQYLQAHGVGNFFGGPQK